MRDAAESVDEKDDDGEEAGSDDADGVKRLSEETLTLVLAAEIAGHYAGGFVVDGLVSQHAAPGVVARALAAALGLAKVGGAG